MPIYVEGEDFSGTLLLPICSLHKAYKLAMGDASAHSIRSYRVAYRWGGALGSPLA